ncbi:hypothetical protein GGR50DRAFT_364594 [Xylaria sp. CBS 124048]|nr:hypothetical protein GGR50DRAFT_364594 [Xylaria sp. CBS 124048]
MSHPPDNMVVTPRRPEHHGWPRWPQQSWAVTSPGFVMEQPYPPLITMSAPHYPVHHHGFVYDSYDAPGAANSVVSSSKQYLAERTMLDVAPMAGHNMAEPLEGANHASEKQPSRSPVIKSESQTPEILRDAKKDSINTVDGQAPNVVFATGIDRLMKIIQQKNDGPSGEAPAMQQRPKARTENVSGPVSASRRRPKAELKDKPHACRRKKCHKRFTQITHLHIHDRAHTGEKPHKCTFAGCSKSFTQKGNLRTHERRHMGERPFKCHFDNCHRAFPQKGNLAAHLETHYKRNSFRCILKSCGKTFSSRGNLKTHQNNYHKEELRELELKFANVRSVTDMTEADRELWDYFLTVHKNSNKGIKGRGKECRVELMPHSGNLPSQCALQSPPELHAAYPISQNVPHAIGFSHYGMQRNHLGPELLVARGGHGYDVYEIDQVSISSGTMTPASSPGGVYDDHHRNLPFHERVY